MVLTCGTTSDGCNGKTGLIRVEYTIPDPPSVRYKYPNSDWILVKGGVNFTTQQSNPASFSGGQCVGVSYVFNVRWRMTPTGDWIYDRLATNGAARGKISNLRFFLRSNMGGDTNKRDFPAIEGIGRNGQFFFEGNGIDGEFSYFFGYTGFFEVGRAEFLGMERLDGQPDNCGNPPGGDCTFKVFDSNNQVIFQKTDSVCPTAEVMPSVYGKTFGNFNVKSIDSQPLKVTENEANNIKSTLVQLGNTTIKKLDSPVGATLFPKVCWDCESENKCPDNTCSVDCGAHICCYNSQGIAVKTILKS